MRAGEEGGEGGEDGGAEGEAAGGILDDCSARINVSAMAVYARVVRMGKDA